MLALKPNPKKLFAVNAPTRLIKWLSMENVYWLAPQANSEIKLMLNVMHARTTVVERCALPQKLK